MFDVDAEPARRIRREDFLRSLRDQRDAVLDVDCACLVLVHEVDLRVLRPRTFAFVVAHEVHVIEDKSITIRPIDHAELVDVRNQPRLLKMGQREFGLADSGLTPQHVGLRPIGDLGPFEVLELVLRFRLDGTQNLHAEVHASAVSHHRRPVVLPQRLHGAALEDVFFDLREFATLASVCAKAPFAPLAFAAVFLLSVRAVLLRRTTRDLHAPFAAREDLHHAREALPVLELHVRLDVQLLGLRLLELAAQVVDVVFGEFVPRLLQTFGAIMDPPGDGPVLRLMGAESNYVRLSGPADMSFRHFVCFGRPRH